MADPEGMEEVDSGTEVDSTEPNPAHYGTISGQYSHLHHGLRKINSDPAKTPLGSSRAPNRSPSLMQAFGRTQSSKDNEGSSQMEVSDGHGGEEMEDVGTEGKRPLTQTASGSSTSSLASQFGGLNMVSGQVPYPMMYSQFLGGASPEQLQEQMKLMQMAQLAQMQAQATMIPMMQPNIVPTMPGIVGLSLIPQPSPNTMVTIPSSTPSPVAISNNRKVPLSQTVSLPGVQPQFGQQFEHLMSEYHIAQEKISQERKKIEQKFKERHQTLLQQQIVEKQQFEDQMRLLMVQHTQMQQQLEAQAANLAKLQQQTLQQMQKQQEEIYLEQLALRTHRQQIEQFQSSKKPIARIVQNTTVQPHAEVASRKSNDSTTRMDGPSSSTVFSRAPLSEQLSLPEPKAPVSRSVSQNSTGGHLPVDVRHSFGSDVGSSISGSIGGDQSNYLGGGNSTGIVYESTMLRHNCSCAQAHQTHPEHSGRMQSIWSRLHERKIVDRCSRVRARKANQQELLTVHSQQLVQLYGKSISKKGAPTERKDLPAGVFTKLACGGVGIDTDTYWNEQTPQAAKTAAGCVIQLADDVASGKIKNGFAIVRPPGHHAMKNKAMGFCYFNNVALAAKSMLTKPSINRVMIVDWDIHHGNGTQQVFYETSDVLFVSIHRYDNGQFFPGSGVPEEIGSGAGTGYNVNIAFSGPQLQSGYCPSSCGDPEYLAAFRSVVIPLAVEYQPDVILVSAGFNATEGHQPTLGGYTVSPQCFGHLTRILMNVCDGRVILALEGGYELRTLCASAEACMLALLGDELMPIDETSIKAQPKPAAVESIKKTISQLLPYWSKLSLSQNLLPISHWQAHCGMRELAAMTSLTGNSSITKVSTAV